jgi:ribosomal protein S18 acetylase RimI-like enzyme
VAEKGYPELFEAFKGLDERYRLVVVGPDDPQKSDALPRDIIASASEDGVLFLGMRTNVDELYAAMDLFVLPSHREGFPRAAMEAAAMGLPIVATDIRGCREVVVPDVNGLLVPVKDPPELRKAIEAVGGESTKRIEMGRASRSLALERFDERRVVEIVMGTYRELLSAKGLAHLLPEPESGELEPSAPRRARSTDARALAGMHLTELDTGFLSRLGPRFLSVLYGALIEWPGAVVLVVDDQMGPVGFVAGVVDTGEFYRFFLRRYGFRAALAALPRAIFNLRRALESLRYGSEGDGVRAELLSLAVAARARGRGLSTCLGQELLETLSSKGSDSVKVVVAEENTTAIGAYRKLGFVDHTRIEVHRGEFSKLMLWPR